VRQIEVAPQLLLHLVGLSVSHDAYSFSKQRTGEERLERSGDDDVIIQVKQPFRFRKETRHEKTDLCMAD
jgi:hypothetical protein